MTYDFYKNLSDIGQKLELQPGWVETKTKLILKTILKGKSIKKEIRLADRF